MEAQRGPAPLPTALRTGRSAQPSRSNPDEPQARAAKAAGPSRAEPLWELSEDARDVWEHATRELEHMGVLTHADLALLTAWCQAVAFLKQAGSLVDRSGVLVVRSKSGGHMNVAVTNPAGREFDRYYKIMIAGAREFGLTPAARTRIVLGVSGGADDDGDDNVATVDETFLERLREAAKRRAAEEGTGGER